MKTKIIRKLFWVWESDKEEVWLNEMAQQGWVLDGVGFCKYQFMACEPGEYAVRLEMLDDAPDTEKGQDYIAFVEDTGAKFVRSYIRWVYFRKKAADGDFDLFSDIDSRVRHLDRIIKLVGAVGLIDLIIGVVYSNYGSAVNLVCAALLGYAALRLNRKKGRLQAERILHE